MDDERHWAETALDDTPLLSATYWDQEFQRHYHDFFVIGANVSGAHESWHRGGNRVLTPDGIFVVSPGEVHTGRRAGTDPWVYRAIYPPAETLAALVREPSNPDGISHPERLDFGCTLYPDLDLARRFISAHAALESGEDDLRGESEMVECLTELVGRHARPKRRPPRPAGDEPRAVGRAVDHLHAHLERRISLAELAEVAGLSRYHFLRVFARAKGLPPHAYLLQTRLDRALELLRAGEPIAQVAYATGFADQSHLTRRFRSMFGVTPGEVARG